MLSQLLIIHFLVLQSSLCELIDRSAKSPTDIKIGFLVGSRRAKNDRSYGRPGRLLVHAFNYGLDKINQQLCQQTQSPDATSQPMSQQCLKFVPVVAETFGNETESIRQTVGLVSKHRVNFILGPQETCQVESKLAAVFNVGMISHYCSQYHGHGVQQTDARTTCTFIQTKPPHWKIVQRVATLIGQLLAAHNGWYPQRLVLLYYKEPMNEAAVDKRATNGWLLNSSYSSSGHNARAQDAYMVSDALQYKLIGELLEIELNHLFSSRQPPPPLTVLNWHTTFHYGKTRNPFQRLIRRHLFQRHHTGQVAANHSGAGQCANEPANARSTSVPQPGQVRRQVPEAQKSAIYIIVGHYYEHLGLMLALDELNLLGQQPQQQPPLQQLAADRAPQSSVPVNQRESLVIGVDIEQYDERDDSVRYLRGLLMDEKAGSSSDSLDSIAAMYRNYMGVVPAKPTRSGEFLDDIRAYYNQTTTNGPQPSPPPPLLQQSDDQDRPTSTTSNQTTLDAILQTTRLFQFIRLPIEAYYLYDSLALLAAYFQHCIRSEGLSLAECSDGRRAFQWFRNREYFSCVDHELTKFDSLAQTDGHYTLISRALINNNVEPADDESFSLVQVGRFVADDQGEGARHRIELHIDADGVDPIWLPFWCHVRQSNISACVALINQTSGGGYESSQLPHPPPPQPPPTTTTTLTTTTNTTNKTTTTTTTSDDNTQIATMNYWLAAAGFVLTLVALLYMIVSGDAFYLGDNGESLSGDNSRLGWFNERDEQNFLDIVHNHLLTPEILHQTCGDGESTTGGGSIESGTKTLELHCHMFPFPSCRFVHWLTALLQLKEMMFQYQSSCSNMTNGQNNTNTSTFYMRHRLRLSCNRNQVESRRGCDNATVGNRGFFRLKHKGTASLRILLNKYKGINECFCDLSKLDSDRVVKLHGASLSRTLSGKIVHLLVDQPQRGSLREAMELLKEIIGLDTSESIEFRELVVLNSIQNLLDGLEYLHGSKLGFHGELTAPNCLITCDWQLKLSGFHEFHMRRSLGEYEQKNSSKYYLESNYYNSLVYAAPEVIADHSRRYSLASDILQVADFYSAAFVIYELMVGREPWACLTQVTCARLLVERVRADCSFRPPLSLLANKDIVLPSKRIDLDGVQRAIRSCWSEAPERRPQSVDSFRNRLTTTFNEEIMQKGQLMSIYASLLEKVSATRKGRLECERQRSLELRLRLLPESIVTRLSSQQRVPVQHFDSVALCVFRFVLNTDPMHNPIEELNEILAQLDSLVESYRKRIHLMDSHVDSLLRHMIFAGEPLQNLVPAPQNHKVKPRGGSNYNDCQLIASFALQLIDLANRWQSKGNSSLQVRCGLHCGPVLGGLILGGGGERPGLREVTRANDKNCLQSTSTSSCSSSSCFNTARYVIYGNTLHMADVLESSCMNQRIQLSAEFRLQLQSAKVAALERGVDIDDSRINQAYVMIKRESKISSKMFGEFEAHWLLNGPRLSASQSIMLLSE